MTWRCMACEHRNDEDVPVFGDDVSCEKCGAVHETDWDYVDAHAGSMTSWVTRLRKPEREMKNMTDDKTLSEKRALIRRAMRYRSGPDSCNSVYLGSMATAELYHTLGIAYGGCGLEDALNRADESTLDKLIRQCESIINHMNKNPVEACPCCGTTVPSANITIPVSVTSEMVERALRVIGIRIPGPDRMRAALEAALPTQEESDHDWPPGAFVVLCVPIGLLAWIAILWMLLS